jgi:hypothetical protein
VDGADFTAVPREFFCGTGGTSNMTLQAGPECAGRYFIILSGMTGTWPGFSMSGTDIPLNLDAWTWLAFTLINTSCMSNFMGQLDGQGDAAAVLKIPVGTSTELIGQPFFFDYLVLENPASGPVIKASHPVYVLLKP